MLPYRNQRRRNAVSILEPMIRTVVAGLLTVGLAAPQESGEQVFRATVKIVAAPAVVTDRSGNYVNGLQPGDFRLLDNEKPQNIHVDISYVPISLVMAVQANSSMEPVLPEIRRIGSLFKGEITGDQGEVAVLAFDHRIQVLQDFTSDTDKIEQSLNKLKAGSSSSRMIDAVITASRMLSKRPQNHRKVLLLISETRDHGSEAKIPEALTRLQFDNVSVYCVNVNRLVTTVLAKQPPPPPDQVPPAARTMAANAPALPSYAEQTYGNPMNSASFIPLFTGIFKAVKSVFVENPVEVVTKWTGGEDISFLRERDLERAIGSIGEELHAEYLISYAPNNKDEGGYHEIKVEVVNHPDVKVRTRPGYWIASEPAP